MIVKLRNINWFIPYLFEFILVFTLFYIIYTVFMNKKRKTYGKGKRYADIDLFINRYNIDIKKVGYKKILRTVTLMNCFILSFTYIIFSNIKSFLWALLIGFAVGFILIYSIYEIVGRYYKRKGENKNV